MSDAATLDTDVLVIGGGLAGGWAAIAAARAGATVTLVEKGFCGASGVAATAGPGHWWVPPDPPSARREAVAGRMARAFGLAEARWMERILDLTWRTLPTLAPYHAFSRDAAGETQYRGLGGPEYLLALRRLACDLGVRILDHHPALELITDSDGVVCGAAGMRRHLGSDWRARAGAVVLATGGCAFRSRLLGCHNNTGGIPAGASGRAFQATPTSTGAWTRSSRAPEVAISRLFRTSMTVSRQYNTTFGRGTYSRRSG